jgi:ribonuclease P protein component
LSCPGVAGRDASASRSKAPLTDQRFPRSSRLTARRSFLRIYEKGQRVTGAYFVIFGEPGATDATRLGITATRKCGGAVQRNRLKRSVREIFRREIIPGLSPIDLVVNVKPSAATAPYRRLEADLVTRLGELRRKIAR